MLIGLWPPGGGTGRNVGGPVEGGTIDGVGIEPGNWVEIESGTSGVPTGVTGFGGGQVNLEPPFQLIVKENSKSNETVNRVITINETIRTIWNSKLEPETSLWTSCDGAV